MLKSCLEQCLNTGGIAQFVATSGVQIWNLGTGKTEVSRFAGAGAGSEPVIHRATFWPCLYWRGLNNLTLDTSTAEAHTNTATL